MTTEALSRRRRSSAKSETGKQNGNSSNGRNEPKTLKLRHEVARSRTWLSEGLSTCKPCARLIFHAKIFTNTFVARPTSNEPPCLSHPLLPRATSRLRAMSISHCPVYYYYVQHTLLKIHWHYYNKIRDQTFWHVSPLNEQYWSRSGKKRKKKKRRKEKKRKEGKKKEKDEKNED